MRTLRTIVTKARSTSVHTRSAAPAVQIYQINCPSSSSVTHTASRNELERCHHYHTSTPTPSSSQSPKVEDIFQKIIQLDTVEVHLLTELVNEKVGVKPLSNAEHMAMARGGGGGGGDAKDEVEEVSVKTTFELKLTGFDAKSKIKVIKEIRTITGLGLKEAKALVDEAPKMIKDGMTKEDAEELKAKLEGIGGKVEIL